MPPKTTAPSLRQKHLLNSLALKASAKQKYPHKLPRLVDAGGDLTKRWYVECYVWSEQQEKLIRKRVYVSAATDNARRKEAAILITDLTAHLKRGAVADAIDAPTVVPATGPGDLSPNIILKDAVAYFIKLKAGSLSKQSARTYKSCANIFLDYLKTMKLTKIKLARFDQTQAYRYLDYLAQQPTIGAYSYNKHRGYCTGLFQVFVKRKIILENPFHETDKRKTQSGSHLPFLPDQIAEVKKYLDDNPDPQLWLFLNCIYYLFARPHEELRLLKVSDIKARTVLVSATNAKNDRNMHKIIPTALETLLMLHKLRDYPPYY